MNHRTPLGKTRKALSGALDSRLKLYVLSAGAVGASLIPLAQTAAAEIVYTQVHYLIPLSFDLQYVDINGDGVPDVAFLHFTSQPLSNFFYNTLRVYARNNNGVIGIDENYAEPLVEGAVIGTSARFKGGRRLMAQSNYAGYCCHRYLFGPWNNVQNRYLGVSFKAGTETHYGWIRMSVSDPKWPMKVLITGYAYETVPNQSLRAGQTSDDADEAPPQAKSAQPTIAPPASLGVLAAGFDGLQLWRPETRETP